MAEFELPEGKKDSPLLLPVSITNMILAVLVASVTLLGHRASTEELLAQSKATDQWAYYQAKNIRLHEMQSIADLLSSLAPADKEKTEMLRERYVKQVEKYEADKGEIGDEAKKLENERDLYGRKEDRFNAGEALLEVALVICSLTLLVERRPFWYLGMLIGAAGLIAAATGFLLH